MSAPRVSSSGRIRRKTPKSYPESIGDPALIEPLSSLRDALDLAELWRAVVELLDAALPNFHYVAALPCIEDRPLWISTTIPESEEPGYWDRFIACEPPLSRVLMKAPFSKITYLDDFWPDEELIQTRFFKQVMEPEGWWFASGFLFWENGGYLGHIGMNRSAAQGPYQPHERALIRDLQPHIEAAVHRVASFDKERAKRAALEEVLKQIPDGIAVLDWELSTVFTNRAAEEACQLWNQPSSASTIPSDLTDAARDLLAGSEAVLRQPPPGRLETPARELPHPSQPGLRARLRLLHPRSKQAIKPHCLIEFSRVVDRSGDEPAIAAFSLTVAERRVASLVAKGKPNIAVAGELNLSVHTVRAHLREIFSKLGIKRRGELAAALAENGS